MTEHLEGIHSQNTRDMQEVAYDGMYKKQWKNIANGRCDSTDVEDWNEGEQDGTKVRGDNQINYYQGLDRERENICIDNISQPVNPFQPTPMEWSRQWNGCSAASNC